MWQVGQRVSVSFGRRKVVGVIVGISAVSDLLADKLKSVSELIDEKPLLDEKLLSLYRWSSDYYQYPLGEVIVGTLPKKIREGRVEKKMATENTTTEIIRALPDFELSEEQQQAINAIHHSQTEKKFQPFLLAGVTGSGKTEIYFRIIADVLKKNQQALVLVPEIALTPQTVSRFQMRFSVPVLLLHSGLTDVQRCKAWLQATHDKPCIVIGTRSAVFVPLNACGVIIVDEEHDLSFKQHSGFRYSARDVAVMRAKIASIPIILGSATPSLETIHNVNQQKYHLLTLSARSGAAQLPTVTLHNVCGEKLQHGLSKTVIEKMQHHLAQHNQVLLFLNRRGYAPVLLCHHCGWSAVCVHCDARLTLHDRPRKLACHHCGYETIPPRICQSCHQGELMILGLGTEQLEAVIQKLFPDKKIARIDRDTMTNFKILETTLNKVNNREVDIVMGTQMLVKGHHFENVTLVAALDVDNALFSSDFRAVERLAQSLIQVAGRAGRSEKKGEVLIQTYHPNHPLLKNLFDHHYFHFSTLALNDRAQAQLPPFIHLALLRAEAKNKERVHDFLMCAKNNIVSSAIDTEIAGPFPSYMEKKAGFYRAQMLFQSSKRSALKQTMGNVIDHIEQQKKIAGLKWIVDIDPMEVG